MKSTKTKLLLTALILICLTSVAPAQDQQIPTREIIFETSDQQEDWRQSWEGLGVIKPKFVAKFTVKQDRAFVDPRRSSQPGSTTRLPIPTGRSSNPSVSETPRVGELIFRNVVSERQLDFIRQRRYQTGETLDGAGLYQGIIFYAVTAEDARMMAQRYIEYHDQLAHTKLQEIKDSITENQKTIADAEQRLPQLEVESKALNEQFMEYGARYNLNRNVAQERNKEFYQMLSHLKIDLAGTQAKVEVVRKYMATIRETVGGGQNQLYATARQMLIELEADLAGALARKKEIEIQIAHADEFIQIQSKRISLSSERNRLNNDKDKAQNRIQESEQTLANPPAELLPVELLDNKVTIHPVREK